MEHENKWDMEDIAGRFRSAFSETVEALELDKLNETVKNTIGLALDEARDQMERQREKFENAKWRGYTGFRAREAKAPVRKPLEIRVNWKGKVSGILFTVFGSIGMGLFGLTALAPLAIIAASPESIMGWWSLGLCGVLTAGFGVMLAKGISQNSRLKRLKQYVGELKRRDRPYCDIEDLGRSCARGQKFIKKDLRGMIRLGMLPDARMDEKEQWLMLDEETYRQYELSLKAMEQKKIQKEQEKRAAASQVQSGKADSPVEEAIRQGAEYMAALDQVRDSLTEEDVREKLVRLDTVLESLFDTLRKHPEQLSEMERFMEYYLPTTMKLVTTYHEFSMVEFPGENIREAKKEIRQTLDTINRAFEKLLDDMYQDTAFDVMTDASALQSMLAREGMTDGDFK